MKTFLLVLAGINMIFFIIGLTRKKKSWKTILMNGLAAIVCFIVAFL